MLGLAAGPVSSHVYWMLGGTWGLHQSTSTGIRAVAAVVVVLLVAAVLVVLARVGLWRQAWWLYGPVSLVIAVLALVVAGSGGAWPRVHRPHRTLRLH
jgi:hypothetical protein